MRLQTPSRSTDSYGRKDASSLAAAAATTAAAAAAAGGYYTYRRVSANRWSMIRTHSRPWIRNIYHASHIVHLAWRIDWAYFWLSKPVDVFDDDEDDNDNDNDLEDRDDEEGADDGMISISIRNKHKAVLDKILQEGPSTFQAKPTNIRQVQSLLDYIVTHLVVPAVRLRRSRRNTGAATTTPLVLDIGAGKALLTRAIYETLNRTVAVIALDCRRSHNEKDQFYDPSPIILQQENDSGSSNKKKNLDKPFSRVVADVQHLASSSPSSSQTTAITSLMEDSKGGGVIAITKHLCGGATDKSLMAICHNDDDNDDDEHKSVLADYVGACCFAPCCHQKLKPAQYCNMEYLQSLGFCSSCQDNNNNGNNTNFRAFLMLINMSKAPQELREWEYKKSRMLDLLGSKRVRSLGVKVRRILEEGRMRYLRERGGFDNVRLVRYCHESVTRDNLAIIAIKTPTTNSTKSNRSSTATAE